MASFSSSYSEDLTCSICLTIFSDPVTLHCGHSFCRECIRLSLSSQQQCPQCRTAVRTDRTDLTTSHILKSLAEKAKEAAEQKREPRPDKQMAESCPEHEEKLKLFCITDQQLACIVCRDGEKHEGHKFKPVKEAAASLRKELETFGQRVADDISVVERLANTQKQEIAKTKEKSQQLTTQISSQFEEMHQFLREREDEIKKELKRKEEGDVGKMSEALTAIETALSESRELEAKAASVLHISDSERFLKTWTEGTCNMTPEQLFRPRATKLVVVNTSLCLGPYESHLQFFVWKEMLQMIQPREERLTLKSHSSNVAVSADGQRLFSKPKSQQVSTFVPANTGSTGQPGRLFGTSQPVSVFGSPTSTGSTSQSGSLFGTSKPVSVFSGPGLTGSTGQPGRLFGTSQPVSVFSGPGLTGSTGQPGHLFGTSQPVSVFGSPTSTGSTSQSGRLFGASQPVSVFSSPTSTGSTSQSGGLFGTSQPASVLSSPTSTGSNSQSGGLFGTSQPASVFSGPGLTGSTGQPGHLFGTSQPAFVLSSPTSTGSNSQSGGLFGTSQPASVFSGPGLTGSTSQSGRLFGASQPASVFSGPTSTGSTSQSGGLFGASQPVSVFSSPTSTGSTSQSGHLFGTSQPAPVFSGLGLTGSTVQPVHLFGTSKMVSSFGNTTSSSLDSPVNLGVPVTNHALSVAEFTSGQHYWEMDVRSRDFWEVGITDHYLRYDGQRYAACGANMTTELALEKHPGKIGIYLNCLSGTLSFYDADRMTRIHTVSSVSMPVSAYVNIKLQEPDYSPVSVSWY